ncbi:MBL fold metallo-hydrolase [Halovenus marina]|uniref:MBL fold metallo-hydrolase n=1 Tax=Halovenus marina TaxID=3396621 RepID=UPI003F544742
MEITILGSGSPPVPQIDRGGIGIHLSLGDDDVLVDCGPLTVHQMVEHGIDFVDIEDVFFTHHHIDHNSDFFQFAILGWSLGRDTLTVYGPDGTAEFVEGTTDIYHDHIESWQIRGRPREHDAAIRDIEVKTAPDAFPVQTADWEVTTQSVAHNITTTAYRFEEHPTGQSFVYTGDTGALQTAATFAADADVLVHEASQITAATILEAEAVPAKYLQGPFRTDTYEGYLDEATSGGDRDDSEYHTTAAEAGEVAAKANVDTLVLTHLSPYHDPNGMIRQAKQHFDGEIHIAEQGLHLTL